MKKLQPFGTIRFAEIDGLIVILDLSTEAYFVLNSTGTYVWKLLLELDGDVDAATRAATTHYPSVNRSEVLADVKFAIEEWKSRGFLDNCPRAVVPRSEGTRHLPRLGHYLELSACWSLARTAFAFRRKGFARTYLDCANLPLPSPHENSSKLIVDAEWRSFEPKTCSILQALHGTAFRVPSHCSAFVGPLDYPSVTVSAADVFLSY